MKQQWAYYNELDKFAAAWLRELIKAGLIADGEVDERSIVDVRPGDLRGFTQCHFFAGIGVWSYALRAAGWADDSPVWTGSCPCQSFSASGKRGGFSDQRHLWPAWFRLIRECRPNVCFGEQVASKDGLAWLDVVSSDLEAAGYACGACDTCAAGFGAPMLSQRLYFVGEAQSERCGETREYSGRSAQWISDASESSCMESAAGDGLPRRRGEPRTRSQQGSSREAEQRLSPAGELGASHGEGFSERERKRGLQHQEMEPQARQAAERGGNAGRMGTTCLSTQERLGEYGGGLLRLAESEGLDVPGAVNGFWGNAEWIWCRDEKFRPTEPGTFPLAYESPARVGRLRGYGNAIVAEQAKAFIESYMEIQ